MEDRWQELFIEISGRPRNTDITELIALMELSGFEYRITQKGDNVLFWHKVFDVKQSAAKPHHGPVKVTYVKRCLRAIEEVQLLEGRSDA